MAKITIAGQEFNFNEDMGLANMIDVIRAIYVLSKQQSNVAVIDQGDVVTHAMKSIEFKGEGVTVTCDSEGNLTAHIPGGAGGVTGDFVDLLNDQVIEGKKQFSISPTAPTPPNPDLSDKVATTRFVTSRVTQIAAPLAHVGKGGSAHATATQLDAGFMSAEDKIKLDSLSVDTDKEVIISAFGVNVKTFGAVGDGVTDDTQAIKDAVAFMKKRGGGTIYFPDGTYCVTETIYIDSLGIVFQGTGKLGIDPWKYAPGSETPSTLFFSKPKDGVSGICFKATNGSKPGSFRANGMNFAANGNDVIAAVAWFYELEDSSMEDFKFEDCGFYNFLLAFGAACPVSTPTKGVSFDKCVFNHMGSVCENAEHLMWQNFAFTNNYVGFQRQGNSLYHLELAGESLTVSNNYFFEINNAINIRKSDRGVNIHSNTFDNPSGTACIYLENCQGFNIGPNHYANEDISKLSTRVLLDKSGNGACADAYLPISAHKVPLVYSDKNNKLNPLMLGTSNWGDWIIRADDVRTVGTMVAPSYAKPIGHIGDGQVREINPFNGKVMAVYETTTTLSDVDTFTHGVEGSAGDWLVITWLFKRKSAPYSQPPEILIMFNQGPDLSPRKVTLHGFDTYWFDNEWCLVTAATQLKGIYKAGDTVNITVKTYGSDSPTIGNSYYTGPVTYVTKNINDIVPYMNINDLSKVQAIPTSGEWRAGDALEMSKPTADRQTPYVCIADGNPGTWI